MRTWLAQEHGIGSYLSSYGTRYKSTGQEIPKYIKWADSRDLGSSMHVEAY
jgi:hypothetical protein